MTTSYAFVVGANIRAEMARRGVSQTTLAAHLNTSQPQISKRLRGVIAFNIVELDAIARYLDLPLVTLLPAEDSRTPVSA